MLGQGCLGEEDAGTADARDGVSRVAVFVLLVADQDIGTGDDLTAQMARHGLCSRRLGFGRLTMSKSTPVGAGGRLGGKGMAKEHEDGGEELDDGARAAVVANMVLRWWTEGGSGGR